MEKQHRDLATIAYLMILHRITARFSPAFVTRLLLPLALTVFAFMPLGAHAQEQQDEPPSRVGRVANVSGQLFFAPEDRATEWAPIELNYPISSGDNVWLSGEGRAEIDFGVGQLRIAANTNVHVSRLDEHELSLFVAQGRAIVALRALEQGDSARIDTPNTQVELTRPGLYRIDVADDGQETTVVVRQGEANVAVAGGFQQVLPGQTARLMGATDVQVDVRNGSGLDGFDTWGADRDRYYARGRSTTYVSNQMVGYADLDQYGTWQTYPQYGAVWFPSAVAPDWAPYRDGRWVSVPSWGWTWVDYAPWGYAPFHYGRWAYVAGRWGWCPGEYVRRPAWAPALVAWYGGNGWSVSASAGGPVYGWVPLGWREPYVPWWRNCGSRCWTAYNRPYAVNPGDRGRRPATYVNNAVPGAITAVGGAAFASGKPVAANRIHVPPTMIATAPVLGTAPPVKPQPVTVNTVRPGSGVPAPASTIQARTKPMIVSPDAGGATNAPWGRPRSTPAPATGAITSVPPGRPAEAGPSTPAVTSAPPGQPAGAGRSNPAITSAPPGQPAGVGPSTPASTSAPGRANTAPYVRPAPMAVPPNPPAAANAPPARMPEPSAQAVPEPQRGRSMRREGPPPPVAAPNAPPQPMPQAAVPRPVPQAIPVPRPSPPAGVPAPQVVPAPQPQAVPVPQHSGPPHPEQGHAPDKPAPGKPQPAVN